MAVSEVTMVNVPQALTFSSISCIVYPEMTFNRLEGTISHEVAHFPRRKGFKAMVE
jgi:hypothetical protein